MFRFLFVLLLLFVGTAAHAQNLTAYSDNKGYFFSFSDGYSTQLEYQPIQNYKTGLNLLAWTDNTGSFKVLYNDRTIKLQDGFVDEYTITDNLLVYRMDRQLKVFDNGQATSLTATATASAFGDSAVVWFDAFKMELRLYENGTIIKLEDGLSQDAQYILKANANMVGWLNPQGYFKLRYQNETIEMYFGAPNVSFKVGQDVVAWYDPAYLQFSIFYKGKDYEMGDFTPISYMVGDEMVAFVDPVGSFKAFWKGEQYEVASFAPDVYYVRDGLIVYQQQGRFKVWTQGKTTTLENFIPETFQMHNNNIAWRDQLGGVKAFIRGEIVTITTEQASEFTLAGTTVQYYTMGGRYSKVWMDGKTY